MPEGPEIRQTADMLARALQHREIEAFDLQHASLSQSSHAFEGHQVTSVDCRGKALLTQLSSGYTLYSHNQLYGVWKVTPRGKPLKTNRTFAACTAHTGTQRYAFQRNRHFIVENR